jgi:hypothetical protein
MDRFPSPMVNALFEGLEIDEEYLYQVFRVCHANCLLMIPSTDFVKPYGKIRDISPPTPVPSSTLRSSVVVFQKLRSATIARNVVHGVDLSTGRTVTRLRTAYIQPLAAHVIRNWISAHPRIVLPFVVFLIGTLSYTVAILIFASHFRSLKEERTRYSIPSAHSWYREKYPSGSISAVCIVFALLDTC